MPFGIDLSQAVNFGSSLTIQELSPASAGGSPRTVVLLGPSLPFQGAEWAFENQIVTTWYPGNATEATQQNLGPRELPSTWEGIWRRTLMGTAPTIFIDESGTSNQIVAPHLLRQIIEDIARAGVRLRVTWSIRGTSRTGSVKGTGTDADETVDIIREGRIKSFRTPIEKHTDIRWNIEFAWMSRGGRLDKVAITKGDEDVATASDSLIASTAALDLAIEKRVNIPPTVRLGSTALTLGQLENLANAPTKLVTDLTRKMQSAVNDFKRLGDVAIKLRAQPFAIANAAVSFAHNTTAIANNFLDTMSRRPPEQNSLKQKAAALLRSTTYLANVSNAAVATAREGTHLDAAMRKTLFAEARSGALSVRASSSTRAGDIIGIHRAKTGDTPQTVSFLFYKNPDQGAAILDANRLPLYTPTFRPGQILIIPVLGRHKGATKVGA